MSGTVVPSGSSIANKLYSAALFAQAVREPSPLNNLIGNAPTQQFAQGVLRQQSSEYMPVVQVMDLAQTAGDKVSVDIINVAKLRPIVGDANAEGKGTSMTFASQEYRIDMVTMGVDAGGKMAQKRTKHELLSLAQAQLAGSMPRFIWQRCLTHLAGARGVQDGQDWVLPLATDPDFLDMMVNAPTAPTYNRHYVIDGSDLIQGGAQLGSIDTTDSMKLVHLDQLAALLSELAIKLQPIRIPGDPIASEDPILGLLWLDPLVYDNLLRDNTSGYNIREFQKMGMERAAYGNLRQHPLFAGTPIFWNGILVKRMAYGIRFDPNTNVQIVTQANRLSGTESAQTIANFASTHQVARSILMGGQALAQILGGNKTSGVPMTVYENSYNLGRNKEVFGELIGSEAKLRFPMLNSAGVREMTDYGVMVIDSIIRKISN